jgi:DNA-binding transcriptional MerR regulator
VNKELPSDLLLTGDVAKHFLVHPSAVHRWVRLGWLRSVRTVSGVRLFTRADVQAFAKARAAQHAATSDASELRIEVDAR